MPLRLIQLVVPDDQDEGLDELLEDYRILGRWKEEKTNQLIVQLLVPVEHTEALMDRVEERYEHAKNFQLVLLPVEAALPRPKKELEGEPENADADNDGANKNGLRVSREELYTDISESARISRVSSYHALQAR